MVHDGIEQGMLLVLSETWELLLKCLHTYLDEISRILDLWNAEGQLVSCPPPSQNAPNPPANISQKNTFLVRIGAKICLRKKDKGVGHVLSDIQDKVVQDAGDSEGTGAWSVMEAAH